MHKGSNGRMGVSVVLARLWLCCSIFVCVADPLEKDRGLGVLQQSNKKRIYHRIAPVTYAITTCSRLPEYAYPMPLPYPALHTHILDHWYRILHITNKFYGSSDTSSSNIEGRRKHRLKIAN